MITADQRDAEYSLRSAILARHPHLTGAALERKVRLLTSIHRHAHDPSAWTTKTRAPRMG